MACEVHVWRFSSQLFSLCHTSLLVWIRYLQVGLVGEDGITWYKCPDGGGDLLVPGFSGSITCPDAETFCRQELITCVVVSFKAVLFCENCPFRSTATSSYLGHVGFTNCLALLTCLQFIQLCVYV